MSRGQHQDAGAETGHGQLLLALGEVCAEGEDSGRGLQLHQQRAGQDQDHREELHRQDRRQRLQGLVPGALRRRQGPGLVGWLAGWLADRYISYISYTLTRALLSRGGKS